MDRPVHRVVNLIEDSDLRILNMSVAAARALLLDPRPDALLYGIMALHEKIKKYHNLPNGANLNPFRSGPKQENQ